MSKANHAKSVAIINSKAPFSQPHGKEALDIALIFSSYEQDVTLFFQGDGVWQLVKYQQTDQIHCKNYLKTFGALAFYDIDKIFVCQTSLQQRGLQTVDLCLDTVTVVEPIQFKAALTQHQIIFRF